MPAAIELAFPDLDALWAEAEQSLGDDDVLDLLENAVRGLHNLQRPPFAVCRSKGPDRDGCWPTDVHHYTAGDGRTFCGAEVAWKLSDAALEKLHRPCRGVKYCSTCVDEATRRSPVELAWPDDEV